MATGERFCALCGAAAESASGEASPPPPPDPFTPQPAPARSRTAMWVTLGVVAVAAAVVAIVFMLTGRGTEQPGTAATQPATSSTSQAPVAPPTSTPGTTIPPVPTTSTTAAATSTTIPTVTLPPPPPGPVTVADAAWETISGRMFGGQNGQSLWDIAALGDGYVAVGVSADPVVWTSPDGRSWTKQTAPGLEGGHLLHIETAPDGTLVGVGRSLASPPAFKAWTSGDGITWVPQGSPDGSLPAGAQQVSDLAAYPGGYVAVGLVDNSGDIDAAWWTSADGSRWTAHTISEPGVQQMLGVAVFDGVMVAAGENRPDAGIWRGPAGKRFTRVDDVNLTTSVSDFDPTNTDARVFAWDITTGGPGFVAVGADQTTAGTSVAAVWTSTNGRRWIRYGNETGYTPAMLHAGFAGRPPWTVMDTVVDSNGTLIVMGRTGAPTDPDLIVWESVDGIVWQVGAVGAIPGPQYPHGALAQDGMLIVVGEQGTYGAGDGAVWVATPQTDLAATATWREVARFDAPDWSWIAAATGGDSIVAVGQNGSSASPSTEGLVWASTDGTVWSRLPAPVTAPGLDTGLESITSFDGSFIATGWESGGAVWWSADLSSWQEAVVPRATGGDIQGIWQGRGQLYAYGYSDRTTPALWTSADGRTWTDTAVAQPPGADPVGGIEEVADRLVLVRVDPGTGGLSVWASPDGQNWTRLPDDPAFAGFRLGAAPANFGGRLVIAGDTLTGGVWSPAVLVTGDLAGWDLVVFDPVSATEAGGEEGDVVSVSVIGSRLYLTGAIPRAGHDHPALWSTADLAFWTRWEPLPEAGGIDDHLALYGIANSVVAVGDRLVAVGWSRREGSIAHAAAWVGTGP